MKKICLNIEIHQPMRLEIYRFYDIRNNHYYYNDYENEYHLNMISEKFYIPLNRILFDLIHSSKKKFKASFLFSGVVLDQFELYAPHLLDSYKVLLDTGCIELLSGTYSNTFGPIKAEEEYSRQVKLQNERIKSVFGSSASTLPVKDSYKYHISRIPQNSGTLYKRGVLNNLNPKGVNLRIRKSWLAKPVKLFKLLKSFSEKGADTVNLIIPYDVFEDSENYKGILEFIESFTVMVLTDSDFSFELPSGIEADLNSGLLGEYSAEIAEKNFKIHHLSSNEMQKDAFEMLYSFSDKVVRCDDPLIHKDWLYLQSCDHFYYMDSGLYEDRGSDSKFLPFNSHFFAYINFMNILKDFNERLEKWYNESDKAEKHTINEASRACKDSGITVPVRNRIKNIV